MFDSNQKNIHDKTGLWEEERCYSGFTLPDHKPCRGEETTYEAYIAAYPACHWNTQECWRVGLWLKLWLPLLVILIIARLCQDIHVGKAHALFTCMYYVSNTQYYYGITCAVLLWDYVCMIFFHMCYTSYSWVKKVLSHITSWRWFEHVEYVCLVPRRNYFRRRCLGLS